MTGPTAISDIQFTEALVRTGIIDEVQQNTDTFNESSNNSLVLANRFNAGDKARYSFWTDIPDSERRDPESDSEITASKVTQEAMESVMLHRQLYQRMKKQAMREAGVGNNINDYLGFVGEKMGKTMGIRQVNDILYATVGAVGSNADEILDKTEDSFNTDIIYDVMKDMEDGWDELRAIVMHPRVYAQLAKSQKDENIYDLGGISIVSGANTIMGLPIIKTASPALVDEDIDSPSQSVYKTFFLVENAAMLNVTTEGGFDLKVQSEIGRDNLGYGAQVEWTNEVYVRGYKYNSTKNPTNENLKDSTNWSKVFNKDNVAGRMVKTIEG